MAEADGVAEEERAKPTLFQRMGMKELRRKAGKGENEPLSSEDWELLLRGHEARLNRAMGKLFLALPRSPRCDVLVSFASSSSVLPPLSSALKTPCSIAASIIKGAE